MLPNSFGDAQGIALAGSRRVCVCVCVCVCVRCGWVVTAPEEAQAVCIQAASLKGFQPRNHDMFHDMLHNMFVH
jgi:hypothetical protein